MENLSSGWLEMAVTFSVFAGMYLLNIIFGVIENCAVNGAKFEGRKIIVSLLRILMAGIFSAALLFGFNALAIIPGNFGMAISETATSVISIGTFILLYAKGFFYLSVDVYEKIRIWFDMKDNTTFDRAMIDTMSKGQTTFNTDDLRITGAVENEY